MPLTPYIVYGYIYQLGTTTGASSNNITLTDETTGETISTITNSSGQFLLDLGNLASGYTDGDYVKVTATGGTSNGQNLRFKAICFREQAQIENLDINYEV